MEDREGCTRTLVKAAYGVLWMLSFGYFAYLWVVQGQLSYQWLAVTALWDIASNLSEVVRAQKK